MSNIKVEKHEFLDEMERNDNDHVEFPSRFEIRQVVYLQFRKEQEPLTATVRGVHFYEGKVKYDLAIWLGDGSVDDPERETRIYNVDSVFLTGA